MDPKSIPNPFFIAKNESLAVSGGVVGDFGAPSRSWESSVGVPSSVFTHQCTRKGMILARFRGAIGIAMVLKNRCLFDLLLGPTFPHFGLPEAPKKQPK